MDSALSRFRPKPRPRSKTGEVTTFGRPIWESDERGEFSEYTSTLEYGDGWVALPSIDRNGNQMSQEQLERQLSLLGPVDPLTGEELPIFEDRETSKRYAKWRSDNMRNHEAKGALNYWNTIARPKEPKPSFIDMLRGRD